MVLDTLERPLKSLRISVTDRCNLRCRYCMPEEHYVWLPREGLLTLEEIARLAARFRSLGVEKVRITGGEPLLRKNLAHLIEMLASLGFADLALTTNGVLLESQADSLQKAGLKRFTISLDTLRPEVFRELSRREDLPAILRAVASVPAPKIDTVVMRGTNDGEFCDLLEFSREHDAEVRFIEYMDVGGATHWSREQVVPAAEMLERIESRYGKVEALPGRGSAPAQRYRLPDGLTFGIIASVTQPFCRACDRARLTADGHLLLCLYARQGLDLRTPLREGASDEALDRILRQSWGRRADRGAELRAELGDRESLEARCVLRGSLQEERNAAVAGSEKVWPHVTAVPVKRFGSLLGVLVAGGPQASDSAELERLSEMFALLAEPVFELDRSRQALTKFDELSVAAVEAMENRSGHVAAVCQLAADLAEVLDLSQQARRRLWNAALYHDVGKPLLRQLGNAEVERQHALVGANFLRTGELYRDLADLVETHHERYDGSGYPNHRAGNQLSLEQWVLALAEDFEEYNDLNRTLGFESRLGIFFQEKARGHHPETIDALAGLVDSGRLDRLR